MTYPVPRTFSEFYALMSLSRTIRLRIVRELLSGRVAAGEAKRLRGLQEALRAMPYDGGGRYRLQVEDEGTELALRIDYELSELERDICFVEGGSAALEELLAEENRSTAAAEAQEATRLFRSEVEACAAFIETAAPSALVADRDGTVNRYCDRYRSSIQSAYNALYLIRFCSGLTGPAALLTAAPLVWEGLLQLSAMPLDSLLYAGSKGREFLDAAGNVRTAPIDPAAAELLQRFNDRVEELLQLQRYALFRRIGSGFQRKIGESVLAHQTASKSVSGDRSRELVSAVSAIVSELDPAGQLLHLSDTGTDLEVTAGPVEDKGDHPGYDKGDGIRFLNDAVPLELPEHDVLVCGDTRSDIPMLAAVETLGRSAHAILVTADAELQAEATKLPMPLHTVSSPDVLVTAFQEIASRHD